MALFIEPNASARDVLSGRALRIVDVVRIDGESGWMRFFPVVNTGTREYFDALGQHIVDSGDNDAVQAILYAVPPTPPGKFSGMGPFFGVGKRAKLRGLMNRFRKKVPEEELLTRDLALRSRRLPRRLMSIDIVGDLRKKDSRLYEQYYVDAAIAEMQAALDGPVPAIADEIARFNTPIPDGESRRRHELDATLEYINLLGWAQRKHAYIPVGTALDVVSEMTREGGNWQVHLQRKLMP